MWTLFLTLRHSLWTFWDFVHLVLHFMHKINQTTNTSKVSPCTLLLIILIVPSFSSSLSSSSSSSCWSSFLSSDCSLFSAGEEVRDRGFKPLLWSDFIYYMTSHGSLSLSLSSLILLIVVCRKKIQEGTESSSRFHRESDSRQTKRLWR